MSLHRITRSLLLLGAILLSVLVLNSPPSGASLPFDGELRTFESGGRWRIVDQDNAFVFWEAANVRTDQFVGGQNPNTLSEAQVAAIGERLNSIRLAIRWQDLEPADNTYDTTLLAEICTTLNHAFDNNLQVILDPVHMGGSAANSAFLPGWVWSELLPGVSPSPANSFPIFQAALTDGSTPFLDYLEYVMSEATCALPGGGTTTLGQHPAVVAVELINEPRPLETFVENGQTVTTGGARSDYSQALLMMVYNQAILEVRDHGRPDIPIVIGAYFGGHLHDNAASPSNQNWLRALTEGDFFAFAAAQGDGTNPPAQDLVVDIMPAHENLIWTAHSYFTGVSEDDTNSCLDSDLTCLPEREGLDYDGDTIADADGQRGVGGQGGGLWAANFASQGCYGFPQPDRDPVNDCPVPGPNRRAIAVDGFRANAWNHDRLAQDAGMPFFMGEWGIPSLTGPTGWGNASEFVCDRLTANRSVQAENQTDNLRISWAIWAFDARVDTGFGIYDGANDEWRAFSDPLTDVNCRGDIDGDGVPNGIDNCDYIANADQADDDGDRRGNG